MFFHLHKLGKFSEKIAQIFAAEVFLGLEHLHSFGIIYRDLKPENVLFDKDGHVCLTDFGISKHLDSIDDRTKTLCGTPSYLAPEIIKGCSYGPEVDWWSLGVLILEMTTGQNPFRSKNIHQTMKWILSKPILFPTSLKSPTVDIISKLLGRDPKVRLGCGQAGPREIQSHPFFKGIDWEDLMLKKVKSPFKLSVSNDQDTSNFSPEFTQMSFEDLGEGGKSAIIAPGNAFSDWNIVPTVVLGNST